MGQIVGAIGQIAGIFGAFLPPPFNVIAKAGSIALSFAGGFLGGTSKSKSKRAAVDFASQAQDRVEAVRSPVASHKVVYGEAKVAGPLVFGASSGSDKSVLHLVVPVTGHEIEGFTGAFFAEESASIDDFGGDGTLTTTRYKNQIRVQFHEGEADQSVDTVLAGEVAAWAMRRCA